MFLNKSSTDFQVCSKVNLCVRHESMNFCGRNGFHVVSQLLWQIQVSSGIHILYGSFWAGKRHGGKLCPPIRRNESSWLGDLVFPCFAGLIVRCISWRLSWGWLQDVCASRFQLHSGAAYPCISRPPVFPTPKNYFCQLNTPLPTLFIANCCTFLYHIMSKIQYTIYIYIIYIYMIQSPGHPPPNGIPPTHIHTKTHICIPTYIHSCYIPAYIHACLPTYIHVYI